ncbi:sigma-70 family RNA polymerase sigma factor [Pseudoroseicyclus aestuarii]|uniref:RNA polymerase sigma-32 factor n=1 Tax=Pseudoroseicyclus aestuarii TaxID=1795041 RepID=A0A318SSK9_9RHOB|nr:sigma-70 family RNA polymerase sigma factor [Pseudoroseicyclus aestuarii]PYE84365.1 RNA polymerase sigma-32 factor [Pseudoroseicyclus aestuarii]
MIATSHRAALNEPMLAPDAERAAICAWQDHRDPRALELLLRSHARQAWSQAARWSDTPSQLEDLVAEGMIGLMRAADRFDRALEVRFSTYAAWSVMTCVTAAIARVKTVIDIPARTYIDARMGRLTGEEADLARLVLQEPIALDTPTSDGAPTPSERLASLELTPEERVTANSSAAALARLLNAAMEELSEEERVIITRHKLQGEDRDAIAADLGITRARLRQLEGHALTVLQRRLIALGFTRAMLQ